MSKKINVHSVHGVVYLNDAKNGITISQVGRHHLLIKCKYSGNTVRVVSPNGKTFEAADITQTPATPDDTQVYFDPGQVFLVSLDASYIETFGTELLIVSPNYELAFELTA
jgi:hypothetical protein